MLVLLFTVWVLGNLFLAAALATGFIPGSPPVLVAVFLPNLVLFGFFLRGYRQYNSLFKLVRAGQGELFDLAVSHLVARTKTRMLADHYRMRRCQGLALSGQPLGCLAALDQFWAKTRPGSWDRVRARLAAVQANLELGQLFWAEKEFAALEGEKKLSKEPDVAAVKARLLFVQGDSAGAAEALRPTVNARTWPFRKVVRARNMLWYAEALEALGRHDEAAAMLGLAVRAAGESHFGRQAAHKRARLLRRQPEGLVAGTY